MGKRHLVLPLVALGVAGVIGIVSARTQVRGVIGIIAERLVLSRLPELDEATLRSLPSAVLISIE